MTQEKIKAVSKEEVSKEEVKPVGRAPDYKSDGVSVWLNTSTKTKEQYLAISIVGMKTIHAFKYEGKKQGGEEQ